MNEKVKKPFYKRKWVWAVIALILIIAVVSPKGKDSNTTKSATDSQTKKADDKPRLTLDDGWQIDKSNPYATKVTGTVSNNSDSAINGYIQITFSALDASGANVGDCMANANTVDAKGKWKFEALCSGSNIDTVRFKDITGF